MKRFIMIILMLSLISSYSGCSSNDGIQNEEQKQLYFYFNGIEIKLHAQAEPILEALGACENYTEEASCAFDGFDKTYDYGSFYIQTYPMQNDDLISSIWFKDDTVSTPEGISIGSSIEDVNRIYGEEYYNGLNAYILKTGNNQMNILIDNGVVESVQYQAIY